VATSIGFLIDRLSLPSGGTEGQLVHLLEGLDRDRFAPYLYCLSGSEWLRERTALAPTRVLELHVSRRLGLLWDIGRFARLLRSDRIALLQTHFRDANLVGVLAARQAGRPLIVSTRRGVPYWHGRGELWLLRRINRFVDCFLANSVATRDRFAAEEGFPLARTEVIYNGLDAARFRYSEATRATRRAELKVLEGELLVGIVANLRPVKGVDDFVRAAAIVQAQEPRARFVVVGQGAQAQALRTLADSLGLGDRIAFLGARADVPQLLCAFDVGVLASHFESFSNAILEYLACGLPVVATQVGGAAEVVQAQHGFLVPPKSPPALAERILQTLRWPGGPRALRRGESLPDGFGLAGMVRAHEALYSRLIQTARER
jgi:glycosyltransferase involved in cell wall biosynthesis